MEVWLSGITVLAPALSVLGVAVGLVVLGVVLSRYQNQLKQRRLAYLNSLGFVEVLCTEGSGCFGIPNVYQSKLSWTVEFINNMSYFAPFNVGTSKALVWAFCKTEPDRRIYVIQNRYTVGSGKNQSTVFRHSVVIQWRHHFPSINIRRQHLGDNILGFLGAKDIQFESVEFNREFHIMAQTPQFAFEIIHPKFMQVMLDHFQHSWQLNGSIAVFDLQSTDPITALGAVMKEVDLFESNIINVVREKYERKKLPAPFHPDIAEVPIMLQGKN